MVDAGGDDQTSAGGIGTVQEDLIVDAAFISDCGIGDIDKPAPVKKGLIYILDSLVAVRYPCLHKTTRSR